MHSVTALRRLFRRMYCFYGVNPADEVNIDYRGFKDFEIDKVRRKLVG